MNKYSLALQKVADAFTQLQQGRDLIGDSDPAIKGSFESCMQFIAVLIADLREKESLK